VKLASFLGGSSIALAALHGAACSSSGRGSGFGDEDGGAAGSADGGPSFGGEGGPREGGLSQIAEVYGHSADTLYRLDPDTKAITTVPFKGCETVVDIALDEASNLFGTSYNALYRIDRATGACTEISRGSYPNSLSFVPKGTVDANVEALVGYEGDTYVRIDTKTGTKTKVGALVGGLVSSGDIVSVKGGPTYLTVKSSGCDDCLVEVNPANGSLVKNWGSIKHTDVFGLAFWNGKIYGFDKAGALFEVSLAGGAISVTAIPIPGAPAGLSFYGAGSTTAAPVGPK
jgi:hypothetical protein